MFENIKKKLQSSEPIVSLILGVAVVVIVGSVLFNALKTRPTRSMPQSEETKKEEGSNQTMSVPTEYSVAIGDSLWSISEKYYKTGYNWPDLVIANTIANADHIEVGQLLTIPVVTPIVPQGQTGFGIMDKKPEAKSYTIVAGDTLWDIAATQYGNGFRWGDIAKANALPNPNLIYPGNVLTLP